MNVPIKVLAKSGVSKLEIEALNDEDLRPSLSVESPTQNLLRDEDSSQNNQLKHESEARTFKLIDDREWNIKTTEPSSETTFFVDGHSAMSIISVIGPKGIGKSSLLNRIANKEAFKTYKSVQNDPNKINIRHITRGIDIHSTHHRMLLDCQPLLASSVLDDFLNGHSSSQFPKTNQISDPLTSCHMISLQLTTFLIATSDYVIIMSNWLIDVHLLKLISSAIMLIGEDNVRAKFIIYSNDPKVHDQRFKQMIDVSLGTKRVERYFDKEPDLLDFIAPYSSEKCELYKRDPTTFTGRNWLSSCQRLWNQTIKSSSMFSDYALQVHNANNINNI